MKLSQINESLISDAANSDRYDAAITDLEQFKKEGELTATEHKELRERIARGFENAWDKYVRIPFINGGKWEDIPKGPVYDFFLLGSSPQVHTSPGKLKQLKKMRGEHPVVDAAIKVIEEIVPIANDIKDLKGKIVKKKREAVAKETTAVEKRRRMMGNNDVERVRSALEQISEDLRDELYQNNLNWLRGIVQRWVDQYRHEDRKTHPWEFYRNSHFNRMITTRVTKQTGYSQNAPYELEEGWEKYLEGEAKKITDNMVANFVNKNTDKLAPILSAKNNLKGVRFVHSNTSSGTIEGTLNLSFEDGSSFTVTSKLVFSYSVKGTPFSRYPTTFHNVIFSDGKKMRGRASEERMNTEFVSTTK